ncbi:MAG: hypothetical protein AAGK78_04505, partial [Planctomycetota bacterium]
MGRSFGIRSLASAAGRVARGLLASAFQDPAAMAPSHRARPRMTEQLEARRLLTVIFGGESFTYTSFDFQELPEDDDDDINTIPVQVTVEGNPNTEVELFGVTSNFEFASSVSGNLTSSVPGRGGAILGGLDGAIGTQTIGEGSFLDVNAEQRDVNQTDYLGSPPEAASGSVQLSVSDLINFTQLATNDAGETFGVQLVELPVAGVPSLQLAQFNTDADDTDRINGSTDLATATNASDAFFLGDFNLALLEELRGTAVSPAGLFDPALGTFPNPITDAEGAIVDIFGLDFAPGNNDRIFMGLTISSDVPAGVRATNFAGDQGAVDVPVIVSFEIADVINGGGLPTLDILAFGYSADLQSNDGEVVATVNGFTIDADSPSGNVTNPVAVVFGTFRNRTNEGTNFQSIVEATGFVRSTIGTGEEPVNFQTDIIVPDVAVNATALETRPDITRDLVYGLTEPGDGQQLFSVGLSGADLGVAEFI